MLYFSFATHLIYLNYMARISSRLVREARKVSLLLPPLLRANRNIESAKQELKWIQQELPRDQWLDAIARRSKLEPLQYILGTQPFGSLVIKCRNEVLIPRWETEEWCFKLSNAIIDADVKEINILDACCGTGCIPLSLNHELTSNRISNNVSAFDVSEPAVSLAKENNQGNNLQVEIKQADLFNTDILTQLNVHKLDLITSNPPYIPLEDYKSSLQVNGVERSVRLYEPGLALIGKNEFYDALVTNILLPLGATAFIFELGYTEQADHVAHLLKPFEWTVGKLYDTNDKIRCVLGWKSDSKMMFMRELCTEVYD